MARRILRYARRTIILSLALSAVVVAVLAVHSYTYAKDFDWRRGMEYMPTYVYYIDEQHCIYFTSLRGYVRVGYVYRLAHFRVPLTSDVEGWRWMGMGRMPDPICASEAPSLCPTYFYGLLVSTYLQFGNGGIQAVAVPHWLLFMLLAAYPTFSFVRGPFRRWRRKRAGTCLKCGYNLTGNVTGICPECGHQCLPLPRL